jgi:hypothetical protein
MDTTIPSGGSAMDVGTRRIISPRISGNACLPAEVGALSLRGDWAAHPPRSRTASATTAVGAAVIWSNAKVSHRSQPPLTPDSSLSQPAGSGGLHGQVRLSCASSWLVTEKGNAAPLRFAVASDGAESAQSPRLERKFAPGGCLAQLSPSLPSQLSGAHEMCHRPRPTQSDIAGMMVRSPTPRNGRRQVDGKAA